MKLNVKLLIMSVFMMTIADISGANAQNLLSLDGWNVGGGGTTALVAANTVSSENSRAWGEGPQGKRAVLWSAVPSGDGNADGGWNSIPIPIVHTNMYRLTVWLKKSNSKDGVSYFGTENVLNLAGTPAVNPYFWSGKLPELDKWYFFVGYVHGSNDISTANFGGIYDGVTGLKILDATDFKFDVGTTNLYHRAYLYYDLNTSDRQFFYAPRIDLVNGNEPTIASLMGLQGLSGETAYFPGKVSIKTNNPGDYDLAVNGKVRAHEIRIETSNWPDYVFTDSHQLPDLRETAKFIKDNGHLSGIPSAEDVYVNGIELGDMNARLLKKIEELTLHLIEKDREIKIIQRNYEKLRGNVDLLLKPYKK